MASFPEFGSASLLIFFRKANASSRLQSALSDLVLPFSVCILAHPHLSPSHLFSHHFEGWLILHRISFFVKRS